MTRWTISNSLHSVSASFFSNARRFLLRSLGRNRLANSTSLSGPITPISPTQTVQKGLTFPGKLHYTMGIPTVSSPTSGARLFPVPPLVGSGITPPWTSGATPPRSGSRALLPLPRPLTVWTAGAPALHCPTMNAPETTQLSLQEDRTGTMEILDFVYETQHKGH